MWQVFKYFKTVATNQNCNDEGTRELHNNDVNCEQYTDVFIQLISLM